MNRSTAFDLRNLALFLIAAGLAACASPAPGTSPESAASATLPQATATSGPTATATLIPPSPTPTASPTPAPQPIGFENASRLQIVAETENYDQPGTTFSAALSPDGRLAAMAGCLDEDDDMQCHGTTFFRIYDTASGEIVSNPEYLSPAIEVLAFSPDGSVLAAAGCDIYLWIYGELDTVCDLPKAWLIDTQTGGLIAELTGYTSHVTDFAFSPDGSTLFTSVVYFPNSGDGDHVIRAYDAHSGEKLATVETGMIYCTEMVLDMSPDGRYLVGNVTSGCGTQSFVGWWDVRDPRNPVRVGTVDGYTHSQVSPDSTQILVYNAHDKTLKVYDLQAGNPVKLIPNVPWQSQLRRFTYLGDRDTILIDVYYEYDIIDVPSGEVVHRILPEAGQTPQNFMLTPDRSTMIRTYYTEDSGDGLVVEFIDLASWESQVLNYDHANAWLWSYGFSPSRMVFLPEGDGMLGMDVGNGSVRFQTLGFPDGGQSRAAQALRDYFDLLVGGDYAAAADLYVDYDTAQLQAGEYTFLLPEYTLAYVIDQMPDLDPNDLSATLATLCQDPEFPCMPVRDLLYQARLGEGLYRFTVTFALPDGSLAGWPLCAGVPASHFCWHRDGEFEFYALSTPQGGFQIVEGLPPATSLHVE